MKILTGMLAAALGAVFSISAFAQDYPNKPIHLVVAFPPGGGADTVTRVVAQKLALELKQPVIVDNRPGAGGTIGSDYVGKARADGYTLLIGPASHVIAPNFFKVSVDPVDGFVPISQLVNSLLVLATSGTRPEQSFNDFRDRVRQNPALGVIASSGSGTVFHLAGARLASDANIKLQHIPYKGGGPAVTDLIAGQVPIMIDTYFTFRPFLADGKIKLWATLGASRSKLLPDLPTLSELGYKSAVASNWYGLFAPAGTPPAVIKVLFEKIRIIMADKELVEKMNAQGAEVVASTPDQFTEFIKSERTKWAEVIKANNIQAD